MGLMGAAHRAPNRSVILPYCVIASRHLAQVSADADRPARRATSRPSCCTQTWMLGVTDNCRQFITLSVHLRLQHCDGRRAVANFFASPGFGEIFLKELTLFLQIPEVPSNTMQKKPRVASVPKMNSIGSVVLIQYRRVTDGQTDRRTDTVS